MTFCRGTSRKHSGSGFSVLDNAVLDDADVLDDAGVSVLDAAAFSAFTRCSTSRKFCSNLFGSRYRRGSIGGIPKGIGGVGPILSLRATAKLLRATFRPCSVAWAFFCIVSALAFRLHLFGGLLGGGILGGLRVQESGALLTLELKNSMMG